MEYHRGLMIMFVSGSMWKARVLAAVMAIWTIGVPVAAGQSGSSDELESIKKATEHFLTVFQDLDWDQFRATWSDDPSVFFPFDDTPERVTGKAAVEARWRLFFDQMRGP